MTQLNAFDEQMMQRAILLGEKGRFTTPPNPWVGCVIVNNSTIVGEGYHVAPGQPHAEVAALNVAEGRAQGSTLYVTLEPCSHFGLTPPCTLALIKAQVARVFIAIEDPDERVRGKGIELLRNAGIEVTLGVCADKARLSLAPYLHQRKTGRPLCVLKAAVSVDGRIAAADSSSKWISSDEAREDAHLLRASSQAILIGISTALKDQPQLNVRHKDFANPPQPLRVILDAKGQLPVHSPLLDSRVGPTLVVTSDRCLDSIKNSWRDVGAEVSVVPYIEGKLDLAAVLDLLGKRQILQLLVEGGGTVHGSFLNQKLVDRLILYVGSCVLGSNGIPVFNGFNVASMADSQKLHLLDVKTLSNCLRLEYDLDHCKR